MAGAKSTQPMIFHVDIDAFFASVEQALNPAYRGRPVIVGGRPEDRSVVASASYEARARGVRTAMPIAQAHRICPDGVFLRGTYANYKRSADAVFAICRDFSPAVEQAGLDDGYLDMAGTERLWGPGWPTAAAAALRGRVRADTGLRVSIGIGSNRLIARVATDLAKPNGIARVPPGCEADFLSGLQIEALPGVGRRTADRLRAAGIETVGDLRAVRRELLERRFGAAGAELAERAAGREGGWLGPRSRGARRSVSRETSFERDEPDRSVVLAMAYYLTERAAWTLRGEGLVCGAVSAKIRYSDFSTPSAVRSLAEPTDQDAALFAAVREIIGGLDRRRLAIRQVGVCLERLSAGGGGRQMGLFDADAARRRAAVLAAADAIRGRYGFGALFVGRSLELIGDERDANGLRLRTSCLTR